MEVPSVLSWWDLLPEHRLVIGQDLLDFISLVALAITCKRTLADTQLARGWRMANPERPERMPRVPREFIDAVEAGIDHPGYLISVAERDAKRNRLPFAEYARALNHQLLDWDIKTSGLVMLRKIHKACPEWLIDWDPIIMELVQRNDRVMLATLYQEDRPTLSMTTRDRYKRQMECMAYALEHFPVTHDR